jgi:uncharacterized protein (DUF1501 family)
MKWTRRDFLGSSAAFLALSALSRPLAAQSTNPRRFLFIHAQGGWDPLAVFAPLYGRPGINMDPTTSEMTIGGFSLVGSPSSPSVRTYFETHGARSVLINGVSVRSVNHETCQAVALTGSTSDTKSDWPTLLAAADAAAYELPHVVFSGPVFVGDHNVLVSRAEGALQSLINGNLARDAQPSVTPLGPATGRAVDRFLEKRARALAQAHPQEARAQDLLEATQRAHRLMDARTEVDLRSGGDTLTRSQSAIKALADGVCRCATVGTGFLWDTHLDNSPQATLFERLFADLMQIHGLLENTPGPEGAALSESTVVVVMSEMGRTPAYNGTFGRDHWPYTSILVTGPGLVGNRTIGGYTDGYLGIGADPSSGDLDPNRPGITAEEIGATLLVLGDVDAAEHLPFAEPITGILG